MLHAKIIAVKAFAINCALHTTDKAAVDWLMYGI